MQIASFRLQLGAVSIDPWNFHQPCCMCTEKWICSSTWHQCDIESLSRSNPPSKMGGTEQRMISPQEGNAVYPATVRPRIDRYLINTRVSQEYLGYRAVCNIGYGCVWMLSPDGINERQISDRIAQIGD